MRSSTTDRIRSFQMWRLKEQISEVAGEILVCLFVDGFGERQTNISLVKSNLYLGIPTVNVDLTARRLLL